MPPYKSNVPSLVKSNKIRQCFRPQNNLLPQLRSSKSEGGQQLGILYPKGICPAQKISTPPIIRSGSAVQLEFTLREIAPTFPNPFRTAFNVMRTSSIVLQSWPAIFQLVCFFGRP